MWYQITQLFAPTNVDGNVSFFVDKEFSITKSVGIRDAHIETDTGKTIHTWDHAILDFNRAGTPLVEIVTDPDFRSTDEVVAFLKELQRIARYNQISDADMEKGQLRVDVNISLREQWVEEYGTRCELKNMNSFSAIGRAIEHETHRQTKVLADGGEVSQETRMRDDAAKESVVMRSKEDAMDYRYFPEPDLPPVEISDAQIGEIRKSVARSWYDRILHYKDSHGFNKEFINGILWDVEVNSYFEWLVADGYDPKVVATRIVWPIARRLNDQQKPLSALPFSREQSVSFLDLIKEWKISNSQAKTVIWEMIQTLKDPQIIVDEKWFKPVGKEDIQWWIDELFTEKPELKEQLAAWDMKPLWFITGQIMKKSQGSADPKLVKELLGSI